MKSVIWLFMFMLTACGGDSFSENPQSFSPDSAGNTAKVALQHHLQRPSYQHLGRRQLARRLMAS